VGSRPVPDDFHVYGPIEGDLRLRKRYSCGGVRIAAWRQETGIYCGGPRSERKPKIRPAANLNTKRGRKPSPLTWYDDGPDDGPDDLSDVFSQLGIGPRGMVEW
jgi:hypothetical protein